MVFNAQQLTKNPGRYASFLAMCAACCVVVQKRKVKKAEVCQKSSPDVRTWSTKDDHALALIILRNNDRKWREEYEKVKMDSDRTVNLDQETGEAEELRLLNLVNVKSPVKQHCYKERSRYTQSVTRNNKSMNSEWNVEGLRRFLEIRSSIESFLVSSTDYFLALSMKVCEQLFQFLNYVELLENSVNNLKRRRDERDLEKQNERMKLFQECSQMDDLTAPASEDWICIGTQQEAAI